MTDGAGEPSYGGDLTPSQGEELAELLDALGVDERPARVVGFLAVEGNGRSSEIEAALDLRQPEVSQSTKHLRERGWVVAEPEKTSGKGRPVNNYHLAVPLADIAGEVEARRREAINEELNRLDRLREIAQPAEVAEPEAARDEPDLEARREERA